MAGITPGKPFRALNRRILLPYYAITLGLVALAILTVFLIARSESIRSEKRDLRIITDQVATQVDAYIKRMDDLSLQVFADPDVRELLDAANRSPGEGNFFTYDRGAGERLRSRLLTVSGPLITALRIAVFSLRNDHMDFGLFTIADTRVAEALGETPWVKTVYERSGGKVVVPPHYDPWSGQRDYQMVSVARALRYGLEVYGFVQVDQPLPELLKILQIERPAVSTALLTPDGSTIAATSGFALSPTEARVYATEWTKSNGDTSVQRTAVNDEDSLLLTAALNETDWTLVVTVPFRSAMAFPRGLATLLLTALVVAAALLFAIEYVISRRISTPVREISDRLRAARLNDTALELPEHTGSNELNFLRESIEAMFQELRRSAQRLADARASEVKAHYQTLQAQIHPHFLYNLFSVMGAVARSNGVDQLVTMCSQAGDMLRYAGRPETDLVTLAEEVTYAKNYASLMEQRFEQGLSVSFDIEDRILPIRCPKLFLQPIIENCYMHGFKRAAPPWTIIVTGRIRSTEGRRYWLVRVVDSGTGFQQSFEETRPPHTTLDHVGPNARHGGVGLQNIYDRFRIQYGEDMVFRLRNGSHEFGSVGAEVEIGGITDQ